jgi:hypothetical protein
LRLAAAAPDALKKFDGIALAHVVNPGQQIVGAVPEPVPTDRFRDEAAPYEGYRLMQRGAPSVMSPSNIG